MAAPTGLKKVHRYAVEFKDGHAFVAQYNHDRWQAKQYVNLANVGKVKLTAA